MSEWDLENYQNTKEVYVLSDREYAYEKGLDPLLPRTTTFQFEDGDIALFHLDKKASDDYAGYGTH